MATCLASMMIGRPIIEATAMTGEISLKGEVLPIGGLKEKVLGANQAGIERIILPKRNKNDLVELTDEIREKIEFIFVENMDEVIEAALEKVDIL